MINPFDEVPNPFEEGTSGDPQANRRKGKTADIEAANRIRLRGHRPIKVHEGADFRVVNPVTGEFLYWVEVKSGNGKLTNLQKQKREQTREGEYEVMCFGNPPWY